jgi:acetoin utilization deacetylase AcuC-like enzyme
MARSELCDRCTRPEVPSVSLQRLAYIHALEYAAEVEEFARRSGGYIEADTVVSARSYDVALHAAGAVCDAVERVVRGEHKRALCLVRPPGHHALPKSAMGFCLFNNIALGARLANREFGLDRVLIVDWDVHHGNGTQDVFWEDPQVAFLSIHRYPFYPGTGTREEQGGGRGRGTKRNLPIRFGTPREEYLKQFTRELESFADEMKPQLVLISAGFDAHRLDPIGSLGLEIEDFTKLSQIVLGVAKTHAAGRVVSVLEGGYNVEVLPQCVETHLEQLLVDG